MKSLLETLPDCDTLFFCALCDEEYMLPENTEGCPICLSEDLEAV
jgi:RNA polymerase subunit RPABC4/transcription elongation factor Spt4